MQGNLERIYREHRQGLYTLALAITRSPDQAEDAVHDAFVRLWRSGIEPAGDRVAYVFAAVRNAAFDQRRRRRETVETPLSIFDSVEPDPAQAAVDAERQRLVREAVDSLPLRQRQIVVLRLYASLTFRQIGEMFGEPLPTVASRYRRALQRIKTAVEGRV